MTEEEAACRARRGSAAGLAAEEDDLDVVTVREDLIPGPGGVSTGISPPRLKDSPYCRSPAAS